jgi:two-component system sensor histidine kinase HydH
MSLWSFLAGAVLLSPLWIALTVWVTRRWGIYTSRSRRGPPPDEQLAELARLAGGLAHEIRNPLSTINVNLKLLAEDLDRYKDEDHRRWLRRLHGVEEETERLRVILDDFLRFAGKYELVLIETDLRRLVDELVDFFTPQAEANHVLMRATLPGEPVRCRVDVKLIKQAVLNLMINAVQAMHEGGELLIRMGRARGEVTIEVTDTGTGIAPDELPRIFQVYYSTKKGGTGLGLPTTRRIIREHGGSVRVHSEPGKGTRFVIALPVEA